MSANVALLNPKSRENLATYLFGRESVGITEPDLLKVTRYFRELNNSIITNFMAQFKKTAYLDYVKISTPASLNLGVCASIIMYDRFSKSGCPQGYRALI